ncbi:MAG TPA: dihydrolipoamide succinyltransferase [Thioploca sp.]|nr:dihydrolipoamide succinyltransferase [Thioploca sp.]
MSDVEVKVPILAKSTAKLLNWQKKMGDIVKEGERLIEIETDKVILDILAPQDGKIIKILKSNNETVSGGENIAILNIAILDKNCDDIKPNLPINKMLDKTVGPITNKGISPISDTDISRSDNIEIPNNPTRNCTSSPPCGKEQLLMTHAQPLLNAQHKHVILTVFDEVNMQIVQDLCIKNNQFFEKHHGVKLGLISFFTKAVVTALKKFTIINTSIKNNDVIYHDYYDIGITIPKYNIIPILRNADMMSFADIEKTIINFTKKASDAKLSVEEITGGTFTITNICNAMLSTPILNFPQSAVLGIHNIIERPIVKNGKIVIQPMMFIALSYDQRLIDNNVAVQFLIAVKNSIEDPSRLLLEI